MNPENLATRECSRPV